MTGRFGENRFGDRDEHPPAMHSFDEFFGNPLDGLSLVPCFTGRTRKHARQGFRCLTDDGDLACLGNDNRKLVFMGQRATGTFQSCAEPTITLRIPKILTLRTDCRERADDTPITHYDGALDRAYLLAPAQAGVAEFLKSFREFPPRQKAASFRVDPVLEKMAEAVGGSQHWRQSLVPRRPRELSPVDPNPTPAYVPSAANSCPRRRGSLRRRAASQVTPTSVRGSTGSSRTRAPRWRPWFASTARGGRRPK